MSRPEKVVCVFCGSAYGNDKQYSILAQELGTKLLQNGFGIVYGGGTTGLMGEVAKSCVSGGGYVHGIIPNALITRERDLDTLDLAVRESVDNHTGVTLIPGEEEYGHTTIVQDMHTRKKMMGDEATNGFIAMPGGYGTLEELMEVTTWSQLGIHAKPIVLFNMNGFYDKLVDVIKDMISKGFVSKLNGDILVVANTADEVIEAINNYNAPLGRYNLHWDSIGN